MEPKFYPLVFIASPVSHPDQSKVAERVEAAARFAAWVFEREQKNVFLAAVVDMGWSKYLSGQKSFAWWELNMQIFMVPAEACYVLCLEGWEKSSGVALESKVANNLGKPVLYYYQTADGFERKT